MKQVNVENDKVTLVSLNSKLPASGIHPFVIEDNVEVYAEWISNGDGTFTEPPLVITNLHINTERDNRTNLPVTVTVSYGTPAQKTFPVDMANGGRENIGDLALMGVIKNGAGISTDFTFRDADDVDQTLTNTEVIEMGMQAVAAYDAYYKKSWALKALDPIPNNYRDDTHWM